MRPRNRWIKLFLIAFPIALSVPVIFFLVAGPEDPVVFHQKFRIWKLILVVIAIFALCFLVVGIRFAMSEYPVQVELEEFQEQLKTDQDIGKNPRDYPGVSVIPEYSAPTDGPGRYRVDGVQRDSKQDTITEIQANSAANAKVKAELEGIVVTSVTKIA